MATDRRTELTPLKVRLIERWVARRLGSIDHERRVAKLALALFDLTAPLHRLGTTEKRLLQLSSLVHDVGRCVDDDDHPAAGAQMIQEDTWLQLTAYERRVLGYLTLYHRGAVPDTGRDEVLEEGDGRRALRLVLAILRAADTLDSRNLESPRVVLALRGRQLQVNAYLDKDCDKARKTYRRRKKFRLLEDILGIQVNVQVHCAEDLQLVA